MRRAKPQPIRNKLDLTDRTQVRLTPQIIRRRADDHRRTSRQFAIRDQQGSHATKGGRAVTADQGPASRDYRFGKRQ